MNKSPRYYGLPHDDWRPHGEETVERLLAKKDKSVTILQAPVGSGKTSLAKAMSITPKGITALVKSKMLQTSNYSETYNFDVLFGRSNYPCVHPDNENEYPTVANCIYEGEMEACEYADKCPFLKQKYKVMGSKSRSLNYALYLSSGWTRQENKATTYLFLDEAHTVSDEIVEWYGCTVKDIDRIKYRLPEFPSIYQSGVEGTGKALEWLERSLGIIDARLAEIENNSDLSGKDGKLERFMVKLRVSYNALSDSSRDWYIRSGERVLEWNGNMRPGFVVKPLTARYHFPKAFLGIYPRVVLMSATIGEPKAFAEELGITSYEYDSVPNQWPPETRPVHVADVPSLGYKSPQSHWDKQALEVKKVLDGLPSDWSGIAHTTSWKMARDTYYRLIKAGVDKRRLFVPQQGTGTNGQMAEWNDVKSRSKGNGLIIITPSMSEGVSLNNERICLILKTPFPACPPGSFESERMAYSKSFYQLRTAWGIEQRAGRTRRGNPEDYDNSFTKNGYVGIFDGAFVRMGVRKYCSDDFTRSLIYD